MKNPITFLTVQQQPNGNDCGVFAIAFAVSLLFNIEPDKVRYDPNLMRQHLIKTFESNVIEHFPQDLKYGVPEKELSLLAKKIKDVRIHRKYVNEKSQSKYLDKNFNLHHSKERLNNFSQTVNLLNENVYSITTTIKQVNNEYENELYSKNIINFEKNITNNLRSDNKQTKVNIHDINNDTDNNEVKFVCYQQNSEIEDISKKEHQEKKI